MVRIDFSHALAMVDKARASSCTAAWRAVFARTLFIGLALNVGAFELFSRCDPDPLPHVERLVEHASSVVAVHAHDLSRNLPERSLALNFLANLRRLDARTAHDFRASGLTHLLALSGGQLGPFAALVAALASAVCVATMHMLRKRAATSLLAISRRIQPVVSVLVALTLSFLFGFTGALMRVSVLRFASRLPFVQTFGTTLVRIEPAVPETNWVRLFLLCVATLVFGNPFASVSFLLSALGAAIAQIAFRISGSCFDVLSGASSTHGLLRDCARALTAAIISSVLLSVLLWPVFRVSPVTAALANLVAVPLVNFVLAPLSLFILFSKLLFSSPPEWMLQLFNGALALLGSCAREFARGQTPATAGETLVAIRSCHVYLSILLSGTWALLDACDSVWRFKTLARIPPRSG